MDETPIANEEEYMAALAELSRLMDLNPPAESDDAAAIEHWAERIEAYERIHYPMEES